MRCQYGSRRAEQGGDKGITRGQAATGVLPAGDHQDVVFVEEGQAARGDLFGADVILPFGADLGEGGGVVAASGGEVAAEAEHVRPLHQPELGQLLVGA